MLELVLLNTFLVFPFKSKKISWYTRSWGLMLGTCVSFFLFFSPLSSMKMHSALTQIDGLSSLLIMLTWWISFLMMLASHKSVMMSNNNASSFSFFVCLLNLTLTMTFLFSNIMWFYIFFELALIPTLILILGWGYQPERLQAGMYMMLYTITASLPLLVLILCASIFFSSSSIFFLNLLQSLFVTNLTWMDNVLFLVAMGAFLVKLPMFSVHLWLPKAHVEAPVAGSMILAGILLKLGGYGMLRMMQFLLLTMAQMKDIVLAFSLWGGVITSMICLRQVDLKSLIAYSSIGHMSIMLAGSLSLSSWGWAGALGMMLAHGLCSSALFCLANTTYEKSHSRSLIFSKGFLLLIPSLALWWFLFCAINMAAPPSINLLSELLIIPSIMMNNFWLFGPFILMSFLAAAYNLFIYTVTQHGGSPKTLFPSSSLSSLNLSTLFLHWVPLNIFILKSEMISLWF
uniref:NADH dehydrogenase subunit 4 n=1 Tax=Gigantopelta aegis TaxID=1735272 RepID=UPI001EDF1CB9|nr:NADH dehydrogenase subunit 4 [Gigantopelta aegis]UKE79908.1 NADH dehydrogenase subunit 4 [Gigantopelta aegis]